MKRPVSCVASLLLAMAMSSACSDAKAGKIELAEVCQQKMGGTQANCSCYADTIQADLSDEQFSKLAQGVYDNRRFGGILPEDLRRDGLIESAVANAAASCLG